MPRRRTCRGTPRLVALETAAQQRALLAPEARGRELAARLERGLAELESGSMRRSIERLAAAWEQGDLVAIERYESWCGCVTTDDDRKALAALNDERNPELAERIDTLHREGKRVFAAVGALHMTGPRALPALLAGRGYTVRRVPLGASGASE